MKTCRTCGLDKAEDQFYQRSDSDDGLRADCIDCHKARSYLSRDTPRRKFQRRESHYYSKYGISLKEYEQMYAERGGCCDICGRKENQLEVDHCHTTSVIRGLLCPKCNSILGYAYDNPEILREAARYLEKERPKLSILQIFNILSESR